VPILAQADDVVTVQRYKNAVIDAFNSLEMEEQRGAAINYDKENIYEKG
jgi:hypothetical protein